MKRLLRYLTGPRPDHRRNWRRCWRYCRCGWRWRCPDFFELEPAPDQPPPLGFTEVERAEIRALSATQPPVTPDLPPPPPRPRARTNNRWPGWDAPTRSHSANGGAAELTPAQGYRARHGTRV